MDCGDGVASDKKLRPEANRVGAMTPFESAPFGKTTYNSENTDVAASYAAHSENKFPTQLERVDGGGTRNLLAVLTWHENR
ncbi:hypothetical protein RB195_010931 [Necator americanus]|uniref:Uncharacterized protein n=1 Tax=Necator americanus TaxID=51031 RepID=A0ABR1D040_NECAM